MGVGIILTNAARALEGHWEANGHRLQTSEAEKWSKVFPYAPLVKRDKEHRRHSTYSRQVQNIVRADCEKKKKQERKLLLDMGGLDVQKLYYP